MDTAVLDRPVNEAVKRRAGMVAAKPARPQVTENISPSGDPYFLNPANLAAIERGAQQIREGKGIRFETAAEAISYFDKL